jgi:hypothetical protein
VQHVGPGSPVGDDALAVAEHDLGIGADVDHQHHALLMMGLFGQHGAGRVRADMAGDTRQHVDARAEIDRQAEFAAPAMDCARNCKRERRLAEFGRVDAQKQMVHDRVADEHGIEDVVLFDAALPTDFLDQRVDGAAHRLGHGHASVRVHHHIGDPAHQVLAEADLRVRCARGGGDTS